jgi:membrane associated rhomboid family serine protease
MSKVEMNAYEAVLRMCADASPNPWYPQQYSRRSGTPMREVNSVLSELWQQGLLEKAPAHPDHGPGLRLSAKGWEVLNDARALHRVRQGVATDDGERGEAAREALRPQRPPYVSRILLGMNVVVFLYGLWQANQAGVAQNYLTGNIGEKSFEVLHHLGLLTALDWLNGEWWKTLTACFVHIGGLHILMNMYMLYSAGQYIERIWGPIRFLVIYLIAGVTGSMTGVAASPIGVAGASTALFGIFAAEGVWVLFNGRYLPKQVAREWRNHLLVNALLLVFVSLLPGISGWGHAGGAAAGAAAAVCLHYQRFGPPVWRWAALLGLLPIPLGGLYFINYHRHHDEIWAKAEVLDFKHEYKHDIDEPLTSEMRTAFREKVRPVLVDQRAERRDEAQKEGALSVLAEQRKELQAWQTQLQHLGPYISNKASEDRQKALDAVKARLDIYTRAERCLKEGEKFPAKEDKELMELIAATPELQSPEERHRAEVKKREETEEERQARLKHEREVEAEWKKKQEQQVEIEKFKTEFDDKIAAPLNAAHNKYYDGPSEHIDRKANQRVEPTVKKYIVTLNDNYAKLNGVLKVLPTFEQPNLPDVCRQALADSKTYAMEFAKLLEMSIHGLEAGDKWTAEDRGAWNKQQEKVKMLRSMWETSKGKLD